MTEHVCPYWVGYLLASPVRRIFQNPHKLLAPYIRDGMTVIEPGPAMGFFTLELARLVGSLGHVVAIDVQPKMLQALAERARKAGLGERIELREPRGESMNVDDLEGKVDAVLAALVVHELPNAPLFFEEMYRVMKPQGTLLLIEPAGHVKLPAWEKTLQDARSTGLEDRGRLRTGRFHSALLVKP